VSSHANRLRDDLPGAGQYSVLPGQHGQDSGELRQALVAEIAPRLTAVRHNLSAALEGQLPEASTLYESARMLGRAELWCRR